MHKGYYISCQPPYGYKVNPNDPNQLVIDEEVVEIVKLIFRLALNNKGVYFEDDKYYYWGKIGVPKWMR